MDTGITDIKVRKLDGTGNILAFADITLIGKYVVRGFKVMTGDNGPWVSMPSRRDRGGNFQDTFFPLDTATRNQLIDVILKKYESMGPQEPPR